MPPSPPATNQPATAAAPPAENCKETTTNNDGNYAATADVRTGEENATDEEEEADQQTSYASFSSDADQIATLSTDLNPLRTERRTDTQYWHIVLPGGRNAAQVSDKTRNVDNNP